MGIKGLHGTSGKEMKTTAMIISTPKSGVVHERGECFAACDAFAADGQWRDWQSEFVSKFSSLHVVSLRLVQHRGAELEHAKKKQHSWHSVTCRIQHSWH